MPLTFALTDGVLRYTTVGEVEFEDGLAVLVAGLTAAAAEPRAGGWHLLFDIRYSSENRGSGDIRRIAAEIAARRNALSGFGVVIVSSPLHFGLGRMFGAFIEPGGIQVGVFYDEATALTWLANPTEG